uniref:ECRG4 augurin precursor a n=1 Tax=Gadus morhua TaxID=8049 RepID=A0A8C5FCV4_GADMO
MPSRSEHMQTIPSLYITILLCLFSLWPQATTCVLFWYVGAPSKSAVAISPSKAQEFLAKLNRPKRNVWDRSRPDVQQWIQQFMYMGFDEQRLETDMAYWLDQSRATDQGRQHHHDENSPHANGDPGNYRHGANVNYDYY